MLSRLDTPVVGAGTVALLVAVVLVVVVVLSQLAMALEVILCTHTMWCRSYYSAQTSVVHACYHRLSEPQRLEKCFGQQNSTMHRFVLISLLKV
jgi:hypothetical protein